ncbi:flavodoxin [Kribbella qitaiheensis]|uniref:Flavodoxin n=1 Tax=Kribbella qitaiheensis TaxID=1544730 RepID=A0A7G6WSL8_9ACTN|nr:flavodoxin domain-containing protein [Kribbella qitaiheensis]QNE16983.1 flavodoxin [Kribbella qitaiheensis]
MSRKVLVAYATKMGATAGIAAAIGEELERGGHQVDVCEVDQVGSIEEYEAVVLGSAIYVKRWRPEAVRFLRKYREELRSRQVWLFHSGPVGPDKDQLQEMPGNVKRLAHRIGATPAMTFAGRLDPATAKGFIAKRLARSELSGDARDWELIRAWSSDIGAAIHAIESAPWQRGMDYRRHG